MPIHGRPSTYSRGCRCEPCRRAHGEMMKEYRRRLHARLVADPDLVEHGVAATYSVWGCRCPACRAANTATGAENLAKRAAKLAADPSTPVRHGTAGTYSNYRCRCPLCSDANRLKGLARARALREAS